MEAGHGVGRALDGAATSAIDAVFVTGGTSIVPAVRCLVERRLAPGRVHCGDLLRSLASGLALIAADGAT